MLHVEKNTDQDSWDALVQAHAGHPLQLWGWGEVKSRHNWRVERVEIRDSKDIVGLAQLLIRVLPKPFGPLIYVPRGPVAPQKRGEVLDALTTYVRTTYHPVALTIEPDWQDMPAVSGWKHSRNTILIPRTLILDLTQTEEDLLAHMSKKTRQYIRKSTGDGVVVRHVTEEKDLESALSIYKDTAARAGFALHGDDYYQDIFTHMRDDAPLFAAYSGDQMVAFLWPVVSAQTAFELYGGMNDEGQRLRANYALKWEVIRQMKARGVTRYDMNGLLNDGVSTFKQSFADHEDMLVGTYDRPLSSLYTAWTRGLPLVKKAVRLIKR